jgi:septum formation protein
LKGTGKAKPEVILASRSPRRRELLRLLNVPFRVLTPKTQEDGDYRSPATLEAAMLARRKALSVARENPNALVMAADTLVVLDDWVMGKPPDAASAREMLLALRDREHRVVTGLAVARPGAARPDAQTVETRVWMRHYADREITDYIARGEPFDKAGAYAIQDDVFRPVEEIDGCYANVMGLPLCHLAVALERSGLDLGSVSPHRACEVHLGRRCLVGLRIIARIDH